MRNIITTLLLIVSLASFGQSGIPDVPKPLRLVNDLTGNTLSRNEFAQLENKLLNYEDSTSTQVAIVIVSDIGGYEVVDYAQRLGAKWGIGRADKDNGVLILVSINDRKMAIVTGYGMEGSIPDAATYTIREDYMKPNFQSGNFYGGLDQATDIIFKLASGEFSADQLRARNANGGEKKGFPFQFIFILIFFVLPAIFGKRRGRNSVGSRRFPWWILLLGGGGHGRGNDFDNFRGGGGGFGGGGGGFGGFGGGGFGGGGSGGSW